MDIMRVKTLVIAITLTLLALLWFPFTYVFDHHTNYLTFIQESVSGLSVGSHVEYNGVEVGTVKRIKINHNNPKLVDVLLSVESATPITIGTVAMLSVSETKGAPFIALKDDGNNLKPLIREEGLAYRVIPSVPSTKADNNVSLTQIASSLKQFNDTFQSFMDKDAVESFKQLLYSMQQVMGMLSENSQRLNVLIINTEKASNKFGTFLESSQNTIKTLQNQTLPSTYQLISEMDDLLNKMSVMMTEISQNPTVVIRGKAPPKPGPGE